MLYEHETQPDADYLLQATATKIPQPGYWQSRIIEIAEHGVQYLCVTLPPKPTWQEALADARTFLAKCGWRVAENQTHARPNPNNTLRKS